MQSATSLPPCQCTSGAHLLNASPSQTWLGLDLQPGQRASLRPDRPPLPRARGPALRARAPPFAAPLQLQGLRHGMALRGMALRGMAWHGTAWHGTEGLLVVVDKGLTRATARDAASACTAGGKGGSRRLEARARDGAARRGAARGRPARPRAARRPGASIHRRAASRDCASLARSLVAAATELARSLARSLEAAMWPELARAWVGMAAGATQLQRMAGFTAVFSVLAAGAERMAPTSIADNDERQRFGARVTGLAHALSTIGLAFWILTDEEETKAMDADRMYGFSDRANLLFAHSCGFFLWDIYVCVARAKVDWGFLVHGISCFLCYLFGQYPYLHYWGVRFLLYELSTPFLNAMLLLRQLGHKGLLHSCMQNMFGYSFLLVRIFYGFTISAFFTRDTLDLLRSGKAHSTFVVIYYLAANVALNSLNSFWLYKMLMTRSKKST